IEPPFDEAVAEWRHWYDTEPQLDPALTLLPIDTAAGEIAGVIIGRTEGLSDPTVGFVATLGVLRPYRKRGLGGALLRWCFRELYRMGKHSVTLDVDAESLTGALRLYENAGMHVAETYTRYQKELRAGRTAITVAVHSD
ncbi:MAG: GNAT family N-acetyltransferase, partial [Chloroflexota bacterium]